MSAPPLSRAGFVALIGEPNAGKSTLLNTLIGSKISIVTHKVQTTRSIIRGITIHKGTQIVFVDTPGLFGPRRRLDQAMVRAAWSGAADADVIVLLVEAHRGITEGMSHILANLRDIKRPTQRLALAINKIDKVKRKSLLALTAELSEQLDFEEIFYISALRGEGVDALKDWLARTLPEGPWLYPEAQMADTPMRVLAAEITREKLMLRLHQELPYHLTVETENWEERKDGSVKIDQVIYLARESHKPIVLGKRGATVKDIGQSAREDLRTLLGRKVHLFLYVKVRENWVDDPERYQQMGLDFS